MSFSTLVTFDTSSEWIFDSTKVAFTSGPNKVQLKDLGGGTYTTTPQLVKNRQVEAMNALTDFQIGVHSTPANTALQYIIYLGGVPYWWNPVTTKWETSDESFAKSTTQANISAHAANLITDLNLLTPQFLSVGVYLSSTVSSATPYIASMTTFFTWIETSQTVINTVQVQAYVQNLLANVPAYDATKPISLQIHCDHAFFHGNNLIEPFTKSFPFNSAGKCTATVIETATPGVQLNFALTFYDGTSIYTAKLFNAIVPNQPTIDLNNLSTLIPVNFG